MVETIARFSSEELGTRSRSATYEILRHWEHETLNRHPAVGLAVSVIRDDAIGFIGHGLSDMGSGEGITEDTVFRVGSITKTVTAIAVLQLWERGLVDLDAPVGDYLSSYRLVASDPGWEPVTIRHLLTHTSGIPDVIRIRDLLHPSWGPFEGRPPVLSVEIGEHLPPLVEYYRRGLPVVTEPGSEFAYSNHGFATLGQIVEEVSGQPLARYFRQHIFEPLGMKATDLVRSPRVEEHLARGYVLGRQGAEEVPDREWIGAGGGGVYSSSRDLTRYARALIGGGANEHGSVLTPATVGMMLEYHYRPDHRVGGVGLAFFRHDVDGHRVVGHDGILPGFNSTLLIAPDDGVGVIALTNGSRGAMAWLPLESQRLLRELAGIDENESPGEIPQRPETWNRLCGRYRLPRVADLRGRIAMGRGVEVLVASGRLTLRLLTPVPALHRGFPLLPDDESDPGVYRLDLSALGMGPVRLAFTEDHRGARAIHTDLGGQPITFHEEPSRAAFHSLLDAGVRRARRSASSLRAIGSVRVRR